MDYGWFMGMNAGAEIIANEYTFGLTDYVGLTEAERRVSEYGWGGEWSQFSAKVSRDALLAAMALKAVNCRAEDGTWGPGQIHNGYHFHAGKGGGLGGHHLPQESWRWWRNLRARGLRNLFFD